MPKPAILAMALLCNLNILGFGYGGALNEINAALTTLAAASLAEIGPAAGRLLETLLQAELTRLAEGPPSPGLPRTRPDRRTPPAGRHCHAPGHRRHIYIYILAAPLVGISDPEQKLFLNHWLLIDSQWPWRP